ncbi:MAG: hypothetical protein H7A46_22745 [Verrucomicrobiales bacterium]|nr:hypothetical protein [Verrucomicrobiales bacterium]
MIYETVSPEAPIRQGDIFSAVPRIELSLQDLSVLGKEDSLTSVNWRDLVSGQHVPATVVCAVRPVPAIVITQDCDALRAADITLCEILPLAEVDGTFKNPGKSGPDWWAKMIPRQCQRNLKWFYLPPDPAVRLTERMAVDFRVTVRVALSDLRSLIHLRCGRLNPEADEHFRERLSEFFRRYPYDEWYPLTPEEFNAYRRDAPEAEPKAWQSPTP